MIAVISGLGETSSSPANGLTDLAERLQDAHPSELVERFAWDDWGEVTPFQQGEVTILIGHSYGGCTSVMRSRQLEMITESRPCHLFLLDPVRHREDDHNFEVPFTDDPLAQVFGKPFDPGLNWKSAICYLRTCITWLPPYHQGIDVGGGNGAANVQVPATDHNSIVVAKSDEIVYAVGKILGTGQGVLLI
jgi:hypothetical protein